MKEISNDRKKYLNTLFDQSMDRFGSVYKKLAESERKDKEEIEKSIYRLINSPNRDNQMLAISQLHLIGTTKSEYIWKHIKSKWRKKEIIKNWGIAYADGKEMSDHGEIELFSIPLFGGDFRVVDLGSAVFLECPNNKGLLRLGDWENAQVDEMYNKIFKWLKKLVFEHTNLMFPKL